MRLLRVLAVLLAMVAVSTAGCSSSSTPAAAGTCLGEIAAASPADTSAGPGPGGVALDCFDGSGSVRLDQLTTPAVVNLWAGWCAPCRQELPEMQKFADAASGKVAVVGVDSADTKTSGSSLIDDKHLTYPMLFDPHSTLGRSISQSVLPVTVFMRPGGAVAYVYHSQTPLDSVKIAALAQQYLGVRVSG